MMGQARVFGVVFRGQLYRRIGTKPRRRADGSVTQLAMCPVSAVPANASGLPDQVCDNSAGEAHHKDGCGYHEDQVDGPRVIAFAHKVDVSSATFVSIDVKVLVGRHRRICVAAGALGRAAARSALVNSPAPANGHRVSSARSCFTSRDLAGAVQCLVTAVEVVDHVERAEPH